jgi:hypothetical protein
MRNENRELRNGIVFFYENICGMCWRNLANESTESGPLVIKINKITHLLKVLKEIS